MNTKSWSSLVLSALLVGTLLPGAAAQSTAFTYQGSLKIGFSAASGVHDFRFRLFDAAAAGNQVGTQQCIDNLAVAEGVFTATLDFGQQFASTASRFVEIEVRQDTGLTCASASGFVVLSPRQQITAAPLANHAKSAFALNSANGSVPNAVFVDNAGKVGIGTTSPATLLHLRGAVPPVLVLQDTAGAANQAGYVTFWNNALTETAWMGFGTTGSPHFSVVNARSGGNLSLWAGSPTRERLTVASNGNVGIATTTPTANLDVRGDVKLGSAGQYFASGGDENLRLLRGTVSATGTIVAGTGWTVTRVLPGWYSVSFTVPFSSAPSVTASLATATGSARVSFVTNVSTTGCVLHSISLTDVGTDTAMCFTVMGPK